MNGSRVTASTAGIESTANSRSVVSTTISTRASGVAYRKRAAAHEKRAALVVLGHAEDLRKHAQQRVLLRMNVGAVLPQQLDAAVNQDCAEDVDDPVKAVQQRDAGGDEDGAHDQRADHAPEQHPRWYSCGTLK